MALPRRYPPGVDHLLGYLILGLLAGSHIADRSEADGIGLKWKVKLAGVDERKRNAYKHQNWE